MSLLWQTKCWGAWAAFERSCLQEQKHPETEELWSEELWYTYADYKIKPLVHKSLYFM